MAISEPPFSSNLRLNHSTLYWERGRPARCERAQRGAGISPSLQIYTFGSLTHGGRDARGPVKSSSG